MHPKNPRFHSIRAENDKLKATGEFMCNIHVQTKHTAKFTLDMLHFQHFK